MAAKPKHYARRFPIVGAQYNGKPVETGQVIDLIGARNDARLLEYGYVAEWPKGVEPFECAECGKQFVSEPTRRKHGDRVHAGLYRIDAHTDPSEVDEAIEAEEARLNKDLPYTVPSDEPVTVTSGAASLPDV